MATAMASPRAREGLVALAQLQGDKRRLPELVGGYTERATSRRSPISNPAAPKLRRRRGAVHAIAGVAQFTPELHRRIARPSSFDGLTMRTSAAPEEASRSISGPPYTASAALMVSLSNHEGVAQSVGQLSR